LFECEGKAVPPQRRPGRNERASARLADYQGNFWSQWGSNSEACGGA
jgi:hypothetical protein